MCFVRCSFKSLLCRPVLHFFHVLVPHLQNRDNSMAPLHKVVAEITMLRCSGNKGCVILKIARDAKGREGKDFAGKGWSKPAEPPFTSPFPEKLCAGLTCREWLKYEFILGRKSSLNPCGFSTPSHLTASHHCLWPPSAKSLILFVFTHCHWSRRAMKADSSCNPPSFMAKPSKKGLKNYGVEIWGPGELLKYYPRVPGWSQARSFWAFPRLDPSW